MAGGTAGGGAAAPSPVSCSADRFCWEGTVSGATFHGVHGSSASHVVAVGEGGVMATFDGTRWQYARSPVRHTLRAVWFESATRGWVVGDRGTLLEWDGARWNLVDLGTTSDLFAISGTGSTVYLGGQQSLFRRSQGRWEPVVDALPVVGSPGPVTSIAVAGPNEVYVAGSGSVRDSGFFLLRFDGTTWRDVASASPAGPSSNDQLSSATLCAKALVVSGNFSFLKHTSWVQRDGLWRESGGVGARSVCLSENEFLSFGGSHHRNEVVELVTVGGASERVGEEIAAVAAFAAGPRDVFFVGLNGLLLRWTGGMTTKPSLTRVAKVVASSATNVFRLTFDQTVERLESGQWRSVEVPGTGTIADLATPAEGDVWVVRGGRAHHLVGTTWSTFTDLEAGTSFITSAGRSSVWFSGGVGAVSWWNGSDVFKVSLAGVKKTRPVHASGLHVYVPTSDPQSGPTSAWWRPPGRSWMEVTGLRAWSLGGSGDELLFIGSDRQLRRWGRGNPVVAADVDELIHSTPAAVYVNRFRGEVSRLSVAELGSFHRVSLTEGTSTELDLGTSAVVRSVAATPDGHVWLSTSTGALLHHAP